MPSNPFATLFDDPTTWTVFASGLSEGRLSLDEGPRGKTALRLDYNFHGGHGFIVARRTVQFQLPETFEMQFCIRGEGLANNFELKITDPGEANVWRYLRENLQLPDEWSGGRIRERDLPFAWGPAGGGSPKVLGTLEFVIAAGHGGSGVVRLSDITLDDQTLYLPESTSASSHRPTNPPDAVFEPGSPSGWQALPDDPSPHWAVDFGRQVRFGGVVLHWLEALPAKQFEVCISRDGKQWIRIFYATQARGKISHIPAHFAEARYLKIHFGSARAAALVSLDLRPDGFSHTPNDFMHAVAADYPRGWFPRYWHREQSFWTPVGSPSGRRRALLNEEGMVEVDEGSFSLEPFLLVGERLVTWADVQNELTLGPDGAPLPGVVWCWGDVRLEVLPWVDGAANELALHVKYRVENHSIYPVRLVVAVRPFQVNPPWQHFRNLGGRSSIHRVECHAEGMSVDNRRLVVSRPADHVGAAAFEEGGVIEFLSRAELPMRATVEDHSDLASAAMVWNVPAGSNIFEVNVSAPYFEEMAVPQEDAREASLAHWQEVLQKVVWNVPPAAKAAVDCFRTAAAHILINRDGPAIQPGPRRYTRSWVRDCVIMGSALAKAGQPHVLRDFLLWFVEFQNDDGSIPAVVDREGVDKIVENDSHGQFLWGVCEVFRNERETHFLHAMWLPVRAAADYLCQLRAQRMTAAYSDGELADCYGLLPESVSHEGYLSHPVHSYWDDFWGVRGLEAAVELAEALGHQDDAARWQHEAGAFLRDVLASIDLVISEHSLHYIPGSVEWADFDPTATANAIAQLDFADDLPAVALHQMLRTYLENFRQKHHGDVKWLNYTAYEIRIIGAFVRVGKRNEANELLQFFLSDRRPVEWNQWPEITWRDPRSPGHLGDVPHTWIAAEYMIALASMVASEREASERLVLASGLPWEWIDHPDGFRVTDLNVRFGSLDFFIRGVGKQRIEFSVGEGISLPPGGLYLAPPMPDGVQISHAEDSLGRSLEIVEETNCLRLKALPITGTAYFELFTTN